MRRKGLNRKRLLSMLLAVAMIVGAAPQTGTTAYALGGGSNNSYDTSVYDDADTPGEANDVPDTPDDTVITDEDDDNNDDVIDNNENGDGTVDDDSTTTPSDDENDDADQPDDPDDADPEDGDGEVGEPVEPGEGDGGDETQDEESLSMNDIGEDVTNADGKTTMAEVTEDNPWYENEGLLDSIIEEKNEDTDTDNAYTRLVIRVTEAKENNVSVADIVDYYRQKESGPKTFNCIQLDTSLNANSESVDPAPTVTFVKNDFNAALELLANDDRRWIDYTFYFENDEVNIVYSLHHPVAMLADFKVTCKVKALENQGFIINLSKVGGYPTEREDGLNIGWNKNKDGFSIDNYLKNEDGVEHRVVLAEGKDNKPSKMMDIDNIYLNENGFGVGVGQAFASRYEGDTQPLFEANKDYRVENLYIDKDDSGNNKAVPVDGQLELKAGKRFNDNGTITSAEWTVLSPDKIEITPKDGTIVQATGKEIGDAYYWVTYDHSGKKSSELHQVKVAYVKDNKEYSYIGDISTDEDGSRRLRIEERQAKENGLEVGDILHYYFTQSGDSESEWIPDERFDAVQLDMQAEHSDGSGGTTTMNATIDKEIYNQACGLLDYENDNCRIDYNVNYHIKNSDGSYGEHREYIGYSLNRPKAMNDSFEVTCTVDPRADQGVIINLDRAKADFPVNKENNGEVFLNWNIDGFQADSYFIDSADARVLVWDNSSSKPSKVLNNVYIDIRSDGMSMSLPNEDVQSYMVTSLYVDEAIGLNDTRELAAGQRAGSESADVSSAAWTLLSDLITITPAEGSTATLKANESNVGEAYYWVKYQAESKDYSELHSINVAILQDGKELVYIGEVDEREFEDRPDIQYMLLSISEQEAGKKNKNAGIIDILDYYIEQIANDSEKKFNCVEFVVSDSSPKTRKMNKDYINKALEITKDIPVDSYEVRRRWIDYNFLSYDDDGYETGVRVEYTLSSFMGEVQKDVPATFTVTELANQGLKVKFASMDFPAEYVSMRYNQPAWYAGMAKESGQFRLFTHSSGTPTAMVSVADDQGMGDYNKRGNENAPWSQLSFYNIKPLGNKEYLVASIYDDVTYTEDGEPVIDTMLHNAEEKELTAGRRVGKEVEAGKLASEGFTSVTWKSFDADKATLSAKGMITPWVSNEDIFYYVKYKYDGKTYLEVHKTQATDQELEIRFDRKEFEMNFYPSAEENEQEQLWLELRYYPHINTDRNPDRLKWEITAGKDQFISFVNEKEGNGFVAVGPGTATVKVSYLAGKYTENGFEPADGTDPIATAECTIKVVQKLEYNDVEEELHSKSYYAVIDVDTTLADIKLPEGEGISGKYEWAVPDTKLSAFKGMSGNLFAVKYTAKDGRTFDTHVWVNFVTLTGIRMMSEVSDGDSATKNEEVPASVKAGNKLKLVYEYILVGADEPEAEDAIRKAGYDAALERLKANYTVEWTKVDGQDPAADGSYTYTGTNSGTKPVKKTFTVTLKNAKTNKAVYKDTRNVTVTLGDLFDFGKVEALTIEYDKNNNNAPWLVIKVKDTEMAEKYLTPVSEDTAILKLSTKSADRVETVSEGAKYIKIACTSLNPGHAWIKLTSSDELKTSERYQIYIPDLAPKAVSATTIAINKVKDDKTAKVTLRTHNEYPLKAKDGAVVGKESKDIGFLVNNQDNSKLKISARLIGTTPEIQDEDGQDHYNLYEITVGLNESDPIANGKYTVTLQLKAANDESDKTYDNVKLTLNVSEAMPKVTFKQTKKVNVFYNDEEGNGVLAVTAADGEEITSLELVDYVDSKNPNKNAKCGYELKNEDGIYYIAWKNEASVEGSTGLKKMDSGLKKGLLKYTLAGFKDPVTVTYTVSTENKKPKIVMATTSDTLYTKASYTYSWISVIDKATGENLELNPKEDTVRRVVNAKQGKYDTIPVGEVVNDEGGEEDQDAADAEKRYVYTGLEVKDTNNPYMLNAHDWGQISTELMGDGPYKTKTDKFTLDIQKSNWTVPISLSYKITVSNSDPKLVLSPSTVTLNKNSEVYYAQQALVTLRLKGYIKEFDQNKDYAKFAGVDDKSRKVLSGLGYKEEGNGDNSLSLDYMSKNEDDNYASDVAVRLKNGNIPTGTYKFKISVYRNWQNEPYASAILKVKVVDKPVSKCLKVTAKGSIDLMDREGTSVTYTPKMTNLSGMVEWAELEGKDANRFRSYWDGSKLVVQIDPDPGADYTTKETYEVTPVFHVRAESYSNSYTVKTEKPLKIKLKQSKPKLKATTTSNVIYRNLDNDVEIKLSAVANKKDVEIADVWLANYEDDFEIMWFEAQVEGDEEQGEPETYWYRYDPDTQTIHVKLKDRYAAKSVVQSGKTWKLKIGVWYAGQALNEKPGEVTCSIVVR